MSSAAGSPETPSDTSATEFVLEEFETTVPENAITDLAEGITAIVRDLRSAIVSDDRLEELLRGQPGPDLLHGNDLTEHGDPEPFTQRTVIEPLFDALAYPEFITEASGLSEEQRKKADYLFSLREYDDIDSKRLLVEAEPINKPLDQESHGIGQVESWLDTYSFGAEFGIATDGLRWTLIKYDRERYQYDTLAEIDLQPAFVAAFEALVGGQASPDEWLDESNEALLDGFVRSFGFENFLAIAGDARSVIKETKSEITDEFYAEYVRRVFGVLDDADDEQDAERSDFSLVGNGIDAPAAATGDDIRLFAVELMNRLIFTKFLEDKGLVSETLLADFADTYDSRTFTRSLYETYLEPLFFGVLDTRPSERKSQVAGVEFYDDIPYLNGGLFRPTENDDRGFTDRDFDVADGVVESLIRFLESYSFSTDGGPEDLDPSVLGNVFEKTINYLTSDGADDKKQLGAFYTPDEITRFCAEETVQPWLLERFKQTLIEELGREQVDMDRYDDVFALIEGAVPPDVNVVEPLLADIDGFRALDPACGSGHFLTSVLGEVVAVRKALYQKHPDNPQTWELHKQTVIENIYGVDIVEPAVEIAKLRLWLSIIGEVNADEIGEYDEDDLALPNVVFNVQQGNSLVGYTDLMETSGNSNQMRIDAWGPDTVRAKYEDVIAEIRRHKEAQDTQTAREHLLEAERLREEYRADLDARVLDEFREAGIEAITPERVAAQQPFHWVLEFAPVYADGGFDVIIGNPPWDVLTPNREDYFSRYDPVFRTRSQPEKNATQEDLLTDPDVAHGWEAYQQNMQMRADYFNSNIAYELQAPKIAGKTVSNNQNDLSALFLERVFALANDDGYVAQVLPGAIYSGSNTKDLRLYLLEETDLEAVVGFENHGIFSDIHPQYQFGVVAFKNSGETDVLRGVFQQRDLDVLGEFRERTVEIPKRVLAEYSPEARIFPSVRQQREVDALDTILSHPPIGEHIDSTWMIDPYSELHRSKDAELFVENPDDGDYPIYQGKNVYQHTHDSMVFDLDEVSLWGVEDTDPERSANRFIQSKGTRALKRALYDAFGGETTSHSQKRFVNELLGDARSRELSTDDVLPDCTEYRIVLREVARVTDERTSIAAVIPKHALAVHTLHTIRPYRLDPSRDDLTETPLHGAYERVFTDEELFVAVGLLNSLPFDFLMRTKVDSHIVMYKLKESQLPRLTAGDDFFEYIWTRAARLNCYGDAFAEMRERLGGIDPATDEDERRELQAEIDAAAFHAYGLSHEETQFILDDFHRVRTPRLMTEEYFDLVEQEYADLAAGVPASDS
jgi:type I restriction-modification system DNA methylase subunit